MSLVAIVMRALLFFCLIFSSVLFSCKEDRRILLTLDYLTACENGNKSCLPIELVRKNSYFKFSPKFTCDFEISSISLFDSSYFDIPIDINLQNEVSTNIKVIEKLRSRIINPSKEFEFNFTKIPDGKYFLNIAGNKKGYFFPVILKSLK